MNDVKIEFTVPADKAAMICDTVHKVLTVGGLSALEGEPVDVVAPTSEAKAAPPKKRPGRPKGSKNKPKDDEPEPQVADTADELTANPLDDAPTTNGEAEFTDEDLRGLVKEVMNMAPPAGGPSKTRDLMASVHPKKAKLGEFSDDEKKKLWDVFTAAKAGAGAEGGADESILD